MVGKLALQHLRVLLMLAEQGEAVLQQRLQLGVVRAGNEALPKGVVHGLVKRNLVGNVGPVERRATQRAQRAFGLGGGGVYNLTGGVVFRRDAELLPQRAALLRQAPEEREALLA